MVKKIILYAENSDDDVTEVLLLFPREQLERVFAQPANINQTKDDETATLQTQLDQAHARIAELEKQLKDNQSENPLFVLGAIMSTIKQMGKINYTQVSHYQFIMDNYEGTGLSQSNLEKTVNNAKNFFRQKANKK